MPSKQSTDRVKQRSASSNLQDERKKIVSKFFSLIKEGRPKDGISLFAPNCTQHNPYLKGGMDVLLEAMASVQKEEGPKYPEASFSIKNIVCESDLVVAHTELVNSKSNPSQGGLRQGHIFRFDSSNKIAEYWDITQSLDSTMPNPGNAFS